MTADSLAASLDTARCGRAACQREREKFPFPARSNRSQLTAPVGGLARSSVAIEQTAGGAALPIISPKVLDLGCTLVYFPKTSSKQGGATMLANTRHSAVDNASCGIGNRMRRRVPRAVRNRDFLLHVALPTAAGAMVYLLFRTTSLLVFDWLQALCLLRWTLAARELCSGIHLPDWLLYCVPDGLWVYAVTGWMCLIWTRRPPLPWLLIGVVLGVGGELGQLVGVVPGTYQHLDLVFYLLGFFTACLQLENDYETSLLFRPGVVGDGFLRLWKR